MSLRYSILHIIDRVINHKFTVIKNLEWELYGVELVSTKSYWYFPLWELQRQ